jgi:hypothetical protein
VGGRGDTFGGEEKYIQGFVWDLKKRGRLKHHSIGWRIILKRGFKNKMGWLGLDLNEGIATKCGLLCIGYERCGFVTCG